MADGRLIPTFKNPEQAMTEQTSIVEVTASDLQGPGVVFCPNPKMPLWSNHPRVFIDVATAGVGKCPYCGTEYRLKPGEKVHAH
jgi:uncharacterized Zn-finger protein